MLFQGEGRCVAVLARKPRAKPYDVPGLAGVKAADLYGNPVAPKAPLTDKLAYLSAQLDAGELEKLLAAKPQMARARVTQIVNLRHLAPDISAALSRRPVARPLRPSGAAPGGV